MSSLLQGTILGRYEIQRELGKGGMGTVYEATHLDLKRRVAIKTLHSANNGSEEMRARFLREGEVCARVEHPHVVQVLDVGTTGDLLYLVMEFLEGEDLKGLIARKGALSLEHSLEILLPVIAGVAAVHREGVVHRDIKPANIFLHRSNDGLMMPKVLDFGIARLLDSQDSELTKTKFAMGTVGYISPEQLQSARRVDTMADQYALSAVLYHCLTARKPFSGDMSYELMHAVIHGQFAPPRQLMPSIPEAVESIILRAMGSTEAERFSSVTEFGRALLSVGSPSLQSRWMSVFGDPDLDSMETFIRRPSQPSLDVSQLEIPELSTNRAGTLTNAAAVRAAPHVRASTKLSGGWPLVVMALLGGALLVVLGILGPSRSRSRARVPPTTAMNPRALAVIPDSQPPILSFPVVLPSVPQVAAPSASHADFATPAPRALREPSLVHSAQPRTNPMRGPLSRRATRVQSAVLPAQDTTVPRSPPVAGTNLMPILH